MTAPSTPEVSVVVTIFREGELLRPTLDSVLAQTFQNFEIVLVDNNADDKTREVAEEYLKQHPSRIRIVHESAQGMCAAKNRGILESRGECVAFIDGDDLMVPHRLERQRQALLSGSNLSLVTCRYDRISHDGGETLEKDITGPTGQSVMWRELERAFSELYSFRFSHARMEEFRLTIPSTFFLRKSTLVDVGLFDMRLNPRWCEDYELQTRLFEVGGFYQIPESLIYYRAPDQQAKKIKESQVSGVERYWQDQRFFTILHENFSHHGPRALEALRKIRSIWLKGVGLHFLKFQAGKRIGQTLLRRAIEDAPDKAQVFKLFVKSLAPDFLLPKLFWFDRLEAGDFGENAQDFETLFLPWPPRFPAHGAFKE
jgi:glycosyltransferase involved in cell wall biosynthesis